MYIESIEYETSNELVISSLDVKGIKRLVKRKGNDLVDFLAAKMFAPDIIGYNYVKKGILLIAASTNTDINDKKLNALLIGDPGLAKSELLRKAVTLILNSRYESAQNSSGKSLTAIVEKHDETSVLRMGVVPAAKGAICALNEIGRMDPDQQKHLLDVAQEQVFTINKYGINSKIKSPTAIIGSANPVAGEWKDPDKIDLDEIPAIKPLLDRLDLLFVFRNTRDEESIRNYVYQKSRLDNMYAIPDFTIYLRKHIEYSKRFNPKVSSEADHMLEEYVISILKKYGSPRVREAVFKIAKMISRLKLKNIVDADDAKEAMELYNFILHQFQQVVNITTNPRDITTTECVKIITESEFPMSSVEIAKTACQRNEQVRRYVGDIYDSRHNHKLRAVMDQLRNHSGIEVVSMKPLVFVKKQKKEESTIEMSDVFDICDSADNGENKFETPKDIEILPNPTQSDNATSKVDLSHMSHKSHESYNQIEQSSTLQQDKARVVKYNKSMDLDHDNSLAYIGRGSQRQGLRPSKWGNPFEIGRDGNRDEVISKYKVWLLKKNKELLRDIFVELPGKNLVCHCAPEPCHGNLLLRLANSKYSCYYCLNFQTDIEKDYSVHTITKHKPGTMQFPNKVAIERLGLVPQGKPWEI
jgi:MoxR-like ATPase